MKHGRFTPDRMAGFGPGSKKCGMFVAAGFTRADSP